VRALPVVEEAQAQPSLEARPSEPAQALVRVRLSERAQALVLALLSALVLASPVEPLV
jgi:hypothetical protein